MKTTNVLTLAITLTLGVILAGSLLMPVLADAQNSLTVTNTNDYGIFASAGADEALTITCSINEEDSSKWDWTVNGVTIQYPVIATDYKPVLMTDSINVGIDNDGDMIIATNTNGRFTGQTILSLTLEDGVLTGTSSAGGSSPHSYNLTYDWAFYASESGDYRSFYLLATQDIDVYYTDINDIYGSNFVFTTNKFYSFHGADVKYFATSGTATEISATVNADAVRGTQNMKVIDLARNSGDYTFVIDNSGTDYTVHPWMFIVPYSVTSDALANPGAISALYGAIPVLFIVGLVVAALGAISLRKND